jgi:ABC-type Mn2+/Zn2+ transport system permease subunit
MNPTIELLVNQEFARIALVAILLVSLSCGALSPLVVLKQRSFWGDALSHLIFPGVLLGILMSQWAGLPLWVCLLAGATATALFGSFLLPKLERHLAIPSDSAGVVLLTIFFAIGMILSTKFSGVFSSAGLDLHRFLFGDVLTLSWVDLVPFSVCTLSSLSCLFIWKADFDAWVADPEFAKLAGFNTRLVETLFPILMTLTVLCGILTVGSLMISALLTIPAVLTQPSTVVSKSSLAVSVAIGFVGCFLGFALDLPMGPSLVAVGGILVLLKAAVL